MSKTFAFNFAPGFENIVREIIAKLNLDLITLESGFCIVKSDPNFSIDRVEFASSIYEVFDYGNSLDSLSFAGISTNTGSHQKTYNLRYFEDGSPARLKDNFRQELIGEIAKRTNLKYSALNPSTDFTLVKRSGGLCFFGIKLSFGNKETIAGKLSSDISYLIYSFSGFESNGNVLDAFGGYGGIAEVIADNLKSGELTIVEKESRLVNGLKKRLSSKKNCKIVAGDVIKFLKRADQNFDLVIADPPWGEYDSSVNVGKLYADFLKEASVKLSGNGVVVILSSDKLALEEAVRNSGLNLIDKLDVLISGKKVLVLKLGSNG